MLNSLWGILSVKLNTLRVNAYFISSLSIVVYNLRIQGISSGSGLFFHSSLCFLFHHWIGVHVDESLFLQRSFVKLDSGCNGVVFVQMRKKDGDPSPKDIVQHLVTSAAQRRKHMSRFFS